MHTMLCRYKNNPTTSKARVFYLKYDESQSQVTCQHCHKVKALFSSQYISRTSLIIMKYQRKPQNADLFPQL